MASPGIQRLPGTKLYLELPGQHPQPCVIRAGMGSAACLLEVCPSDWAEVPLHPVTVEALCWHDGRGPYFIAQQCEASHCCEACPSE